MDEDSRKMRINGVNRASRLGIEGAKLQPAGGSQVED